MNKNDKKYISIIVPVYNVEKYLVKCIDSLLEQTYKAIEIILVDDGSNDGSEAICDMYENANKCVKVIHKRNGGLSDARNVGLEEALGEFIVFVDSDDYVSKYYIENLYNALMDSDADMSISMFENIHEGKEPCSKPSNVYNTLSCISSEECMKRLLYQEGIETSAYGKLLKREVIGDLRFPVGKLYEDMLFTATMISRAAKVAVIENVDYYYLQRKGSIQYQEFNLKKMDCIYQSLKLNNFIHSKYPSLGDAADCRYFSAVCNIIFQIPKDKYVDEKRLLWNEIRKYRNVVFRDKLVRKKTKYAAFISLLGYDVLRYVYKRTQMRGKYI